MACYYTLYQDSRKGGSKLFYGRAVHPTKVGLDDLAERIEHNCSMTKGDCLAVLTELIVVMKDELQNGSKVTLDNFGTFYISMTSTGTVTAEAYDITKNQKASHCRFLAAGTKSNGVLTRAFTDGVKWKKFEYAKGTDNATA